MSFGRYKYGLRKIDLDIFMELICQLHSECRQSRHSLIFVIKYFWVIKSVNKEK